MASRMNRYHQNEERSSKNEELYNKLQEMGAYSNIEGVVSIDTTNEVDVTKVKAMMQNRENYQKRKQFEQFVEEDEELFVDDKDSNDETGSYDIRAALDKAKEHRGKPDNKYRKLRPVKLEVLKKLKEKADTPEEEQEIQELIDTITIQAKIIEQTLAGQEDACLLDDLKSNTMVGDPASIKKIIKEVKEETGYVEEEKADIEEELDETTDSVDTSFYTSSMGFKKSDFANAMEDDDKGLSKIAKILLIACVPVAIIVIIVLLLFL